jgi:pSer/pThr/pTyr-binding forkhead associated (FHA) protein
MSSDRTQLFEQGTMVYPLDPGLAVASENCPHCSTPIGVGEQFCSRCGYQRGTWKKPAISTPAPAAQSSGALDRAGARFSLKSDEGGEYFLPDGEWVLGRGEVPLRIDNSYISRSHARITVDGDAITITDLGSSNGTFVGGSRIAVNEAVPLVPGEAIGLGQYMLTLGRVEQAEAEVSTAPAAIDIVSEPAVVPADGQELAEARELSPWAIVAESGEAIDLPLGVFTMGRKAEKAEYIVNDNYVSSLHCQLVATETTLTLTDLGSTNGTLVGDEPLPANTPRELSDGDTFRIGQSNYFVHYTGEPTEVVVKETLEPAE